MHASPVLAKDAVQISLVETVDVVALSGGSGDDVFLLDNLDVVADLDFDALLGWRGGQAHVHVLNNLGGMPNDRAATLQGVNNIEVASQRLRLFEAWVEQKLGTRSSVRVGLFDLNSEFYSNDAAGLLIAPAFGVGSEIAATGANGPSIFPSTALAVRFDHQLDDKGRYARIAVLNAAAGTLGDPQGVDLSFDQGALLIGELGTAGKAGKMAVGGWGYTDRHDDIDAVDAAGDPLQRTAWGIYAIGEIVLRESADAAGISAFARVGISEGRTTPFRGGWQAGVLVTRPIPGRADSQLSFGVNQAYLSHGYRRLLSADGVGSVPAETAFELTYSDRLAPWLSVQPDLQLIVNPAGERGRGAVLVAGLRTTLEF
ncbi:MULTISPECIES: carbohydrate porin [unclassified Sphingomonas]|uniref:carbohydrate porin n=1 Tax=unclassified Sphingomonas TaxID=196159 RepID=UPI0018D253BF|nr:MULTISPECIES: carbohydrate porin [unclassified Sphingomonas]